MVVFLISFFHEGCSAFFKHVFDKYNSKKIGADGPCINVFADAVTGLLCYEKWIKEENAVGEVMASEERVGQVLR